MSYAQRLYERTKESLRATEADEKVSDEEILNAFRQADERVLKKSEIAKELPIGAKQVGNRLEDLESEGRVHRRKLEPSHIWWLDESEPSIPVRTGDNTLVWASGHLRQAGKFLLYAAGALAVTTVVMLATFVLIAFYPSMSAVVTKGQATHGAFLAAVTAIFYFMSGCVLILMSHGAVWQSQIPE